MTATLTPPEKPSGEIEDIAARKAALRAKLRASRRALSETARKDAALNIITHYAGLNLNGDIIAAYLPIDAEIDTQPLLQHLHAQGKSLALPRSDDSNNIIFLKWQPGDTPLSKLQRDRFNFMAPANNEEVTPDIYLIPLLGFDKSGNRLGYGQGHYDRALQKARLIAARSHKRITTVGLAHACQQLDCIPAEAHDQPLDFILTDAGVITPTKPNMRAASIAHTPE